MASSNGTLHVEPSNRRRNPLTPINFGGIGSSRDFPDLVKGFDAYETQFRPGQRRSLSGIATRAFVLGNGFCASLILTIYLFVFRSSSLWRIPLFGAAIAAFHFLEFWTTARYNTHEARVSSFLLSANGSAYNIAHTAAILECLITNDFFPRRCWLPSQLDTTLVIVGLIMVAVGQAVRSAAMVQAGTNFNHIVQHRKTDEHRLVTTGLYHYFRHPSYFGFFYWGLGTQLVLGNVVCFAAYTFVLWRFFARRISGEEQLLVKFFGDEYIRYRQTTRVWIPYIR